MMFDYLKDVNVIRTCFDYFKSIPDMDKFGSIKKPLTTHQQNLQASNKSAPEMWLADFVRENCDEDNVELLGIETFNKFETWRTNNKVKYEVSCSKLGLKLSNLKLAGILKGQHTKKGETKIFDIKALKKHFGIGCLINYTKKVTKKTNEEEDCESESDL